jgi:hypothetical protein
MTNFMRKDMMQKLSEGIFQASPIQKRQIDVEANSEIKICCAVESLRFRLGVRSR